MYGSSKKCKGESINTIKTEDFLTYTVSKVGVKHKKPRGWPQEYFDITLIDDEIGHGGKGITNCEDGKWEIQEIPRG